MEVYRVEGDCEIDDEDGRSTCITHGWNFITTDGCPVPNGREESRGAG